MVRWTWWDWILSLGLLLHSVLCYSWLGHLTRKNQSPITCNVFSGTLNPVQSINLDGKKVTNTVPLKECWWVAHLPYLGLEPVGGYHLTLWRMTSAMSDLRLPSQSQDFAAPRLVPNYTVCWQRLMCVNNLPKVVTWQRNGRELNSRPLVAVESQGVVGHNMWRCGVAVTSLGVSTKLLYVRPG